MTQKTPPILYGKESFRFPESVKAEVITTPEVEIAITAEKFFSMLVEHKSFQELDFSNVVIVVADKTRLCGYPEMLPSLIDALHCCGAAKDNIRFLIAYGTHPIQADEESIRAYGNTFNEYEFIHHVSNDITRFQDLGTTAAGTPVRVRTELLNASCVITMGAICHHYFAGYGGGRKLIFPGCGETAAIYANHSLYLDTTNRRLAENCQPGIIEGNPLAEDLFAVNDFFHSHFAIHGIMDKHGKLADIMVGEDRQTFFDACSVHASNFEVNSSQYDLVVASCGGFPKDINLIQSHKAIHNSAMFVKDGGSLIVYCQCLDNIGSTTFLPWFEYSGFNDAFAALQENYAGNGGTALSIMTKTARITIHLVTGLSEELCSRIGFIKTDAVQAEEMIRNHKGGIAYIPNASLTVRSAK